MGSEKQQRAIIDWTAIDTVLLDMDGTLLDRHFDDYFWEHYVPEVFAGKNTIPIAQAKQELLTRYQGREGTLDWTDLDYWSRELGLDIPALKMKINHLIAVHPHVVDFLKFCRENHKAIHLVTNAHSKTLGIKMRKTALAGYFDQIVCAEQIGVAKEDPAFWPWLEQHLAFSRKRAMFADDNEGVLDSAATFGFGALVFVAKPSSTRPVRFSSRYPSIVTFRELIPE